MIPMESTPAIAGERLHQRLARVGRTLRPGLAPLTGVLLLQTVAWWVATDPVRVARVPWWVLMLGVFLAFVGVWDFFRRTLGYRPARPDEVSAHPRRSHLARDERQPVRVSGPRQVRSPRTDAAQRPLPVPASPRRLCLLPETNAR